MVSKFTQVRWDDNLGGNNMKLFATPSKHLQQNVESHQHCGQRNPFT